MTGWRRVRARAPAVDLGARVGPLELSSPITTAAGTAGHGAELAAYFELSRLGAVVVKSLSVMEVAGNPPPRLHPLAVGMLNSVGLQGPGVARFLTEELPALNATGAAVIVSIWGRTVAEFAAAAELMRGAPRGVIALEANVSCPNLEDRSAMFAHSPRATALAIEAAGRAGLPVFAKLSPNTADLVRIAGAALEAGAAGLTLVNTLLGAAIDLDRRRLVLGAGGGGLSGAALHAVAVRAVYDCRAAYPRAGIFGVGGVSRGSDAVELMMAGADAVQVGTATLADPRAPMGVLEELVDYCAARGVRSVAELVGAAQGTYSF